MAGSDELVNFTLSHIGATSNTATPLAQGHTKNGVEEKMPSPGYMQAAKRTALPASREVAHNKRFRAAKWKDEEKTSLLVEKLSFFWIRLQASLGLSAFEYDKSWSHYVSGQLGRNVTSCQQQWDSLRKSLKIILDYEKKIKDSEGTCDHVSFWQMNEEQKKIVNEQRSKAKLEPLPQVFQRAWCVLMDTIYQIDAVKKNTGKKKSVDANRPSSSRAPHIASTITDSDDSPLRPSQPESLSQPSSQPDQYSDPMDPPEVPLVISGQLGSQRSEDEVLGMSDGHLISVIAPYINKEIGDALKTQVIPLLGDQEENEQKNHREELLAVEEEKLDLKRKEMALLEVVLEPLILKLQIREEEEQKHKVKLLAIEEEKLALKRDKVALNRDRLDLEHKKMAFKSRLANATPAHPESGMYFNSGQQANCFQMLPDEVNHQPDCENFELCDFSFPHGSSPFQSFPFSQDGSTNFQ
ncbi:hypothetical protein M758_9G069000 [Ceratodon purpureus]|nr:hypothetical protein M758_9G069000 [Ceratodon purpureus]